MGRVLTLLLICLWTGVQAAPSERWAEGRILLKAKTNVSGAELESVIRPYAAAVLRRLGNRGLRSVSVPPRAEAAIVRALARHPKIEFAELDRLVPVTAMTPNDPRYADAWHLPKVSAQDAWAYSRGAGVTVAILDTGVDGDHPDLAGQLEAGYNSADGGSDWSDIDGHGTSVAGVVAAASNNGVGVASVAWDARLLPVRVTNRSDGWAYFSDIAAGLYWAADNGARVANISYGVTSSSSVTSAAEYMREKGGVVVVAAGNDGNNTGESDNPRMITVSATSSSDAKTSWSNYGDQVDVSAPGASIWSTKNGGGYGRVSGTSFASPLTAGVAALILSANPELTPEQVETVLESSAVDLGASDHDPLFGHGRVNAAEAVATVLRDYPFDTQPPTVSITSPPSGAQVTETQQVEVLASDDQGIVRVELLVDGQLIATREAAPYRFDWNTEAWSGDVVLTARAIDLGANATEHSRSVRVIEPDTTPPSVAFVAPDAGSHVNGSVTVDVDASDETELVRVELHVGGQLVDQSTQAPFSFYWDTDGQDGDTEISARAIDAAGNETTVVSSVYVTPPPPRATVTLCEPDCRSGPKVDLDELRIAPGRVYIHARGLLAIHANGFEPDGYHEAVITVCEPDCERGVSAPLEFMEIVGADVSLHAPLLAP